MKTKDARRPDHSAFDTHFELPLRDKSGRSFRDVLDARRQPRDEPRQQTEPLRELRQEREELHEARVFGPGDVAAWNPQASPGAVVESAPGSRTDLQPVFDRIVQEVAVARDVHRRKIVMLDLAVPGRGRVRVRVRRGRHGAEVRFRSDDEALRSELRARRSELTDRARERGVDIASVEVT